MKEIDFVQISKKIRELRIEKGYTQEYIANMADVNTSHISNIENNRVRISLPTLVHVCNALDTTVDYILSDEYVSASSALDHEILLEIQSCSDNTKELLLKIIRAIR